MNALSVSLAQAMNVSIPFGRMGRVEQVANMASFPASPLASHMHGANARAAGGYVPAVN